MKIVINSGNYEIINSLIREAKLEGHTISITKIESTLFEHIKADDADAYILTSSQDYTHKCINFIRKNKPFIPVALINTTQTYDITNPDIIVPFTETTNPDIFAKIMLHNIYMYMKNFEKLKRFNSNVVHELNFNGFVLRTDTRTISKDNKEIKLLSDKQCKIMQILLQNYNTMIHPDIITEQVWHESNYFVTRSLDVFLTNLRKMFKEHNMGIELIKIRNVGIMIRNINS